MSRQSVHGVLKAPTISELQVVERFETLPGRQALKESKDVLGLGR